MKSLVVEDDAISRLVLQKMLAPFGTCEVAVNGKIAVDLFIAALNSSEPFDLICLDIMMPKMDGQEALKQLRSAEKQANILPKNEVKIVMVTALDTPRDVMEAFYKGGCNNYLVKPITKSKIVQVLKELNLT